MQNTNQIYTHMVISHFSGSSLGNEPDPEFFVSYESALAYMLTELKNEMVLSNEELFEVLKTGEGISAYGANDGNASWVKSGRISSYDYTEWAIYPLPGHKIDGSVLESIISPEALEQFLEQHGDGAVDSVCKKTNSTRVREMNDLEIAQLFVRAVSDGCPPDMSWNCCKDELGWDGCITCWKRWLNAPAADNL